MIVVVADDFSGAAEVAGWAVAHGWHAELQTQFSRSTDAPLIVLDADTRSRSPSAAAARFESLAAAVRAAQPDGVFQKIDSVLRGHVALEAAAFARGLGKARVVLAPANPSRGRVVRHGRYFIHDAPLDQTSFARDPEYPRRSSSVRELLGEPPDSATPLIVPDIASAADLHACLALLDDASLPAGAADFFAAWLAQRTPPPGDSTPPLPLEFAARRLLVCGSPAAIAGGRIDASRAHQIEVFIADGPLDQLATSLREALSQRGAALLTLETADADLPELRRRLERLTASAAALIPHLGPLDVLVEGGATAGALVHALGVGRFRAAPQIAPGVAPLEPVSGAAWRLVCKPGSYDWPEGVWNGPAGGP